MSAAVEASGRVPATVTAALLIIGNEILSGRTRDANLPWLAERLGAQGVRLMEVRVVADIAEDIIAAVRALSARWTYVFTTGGIGPTHDDITAQAIADAFAVPLERHPEALRRLQVHYGDPAQLTEGRLRMANIPAGAALIDNPISAAPGFRIGNVHVLAGVPAIMQAMFLGLQHTLTGGVPMQSRTVHTQLPEGHMAGDLAAVQRDHPEVEIGSYPSYKAGRFGVSLIARGTDPAELDTVERALQAMIERLGGGWISGEPTSNVG